MKENRISDPVHPGEVLLEEFLKPNKLSQNKLALQMRVPPQLISEIVNAKRRVTTETAMRLAIAIGTTPEFWLSLQMDYDLEKEKLEKESQIRSEVKPVFA